MAASNISILLHNYYKDYKNINGLEDITTQELVAIWQRFLGKINSRTVMSLWNDITRNYMRYNDVLRFLQGLRYKSNDKEEYEEIDYTPDESRMEYVNQQLLKKYQFEGKNKVVIISESQYRRLFEPNIK